MKIPSHYTLINFAEFRAVCYMNKTFYGRTGPFCHIKRPIPPKLAARPCKARWCLPWRIMKRWQRQLEKK